MSKNTTQYVLGQGVRKGRRERRYKGRIALIENKEKKKKVGVPKKKENRSNEKVNEGG